MPWRPVFSVFKPSRHVTSVHTTKPTVHYKNQLLFGGFEPANETETEWSSTEWSGDLILQGTGVRAGRDSHAGQVREASIRGGWRAQGASRSGLVFGGLWGDHRGSPPRLLLPLPTVRSSKRGSPTLTPSRPVLTKAPEPAPAASTSLGRAQTETYAKYDADAQVDNNAAAEKRRFAGVSRRKSISYEREEHEKTSAEEQRRERNRTKFEEPELVDDVSSVPLPSLVRGWPKAYAFLDPKRRSWRYPS